MDRLAEDLWGKEESDHGWDSSPGWQGREEMFVQKALPSLNRRAALRWWSRKLHSAGQDGIKAQRDQL